MRRKSPTPGTEEDIAALAEKDIAAWPEKDIEALVERLIEEINADRPVQMPQDTGIEEQTPNNPD